MQAMNRMSGRSLVAFGVLLMSAFLVGCGPTMGKYSITVTPSDSLKSDKSVGSFEVHLVGVSDLDAAKWRSKKNSDYFSGAGNRRGDKDVFRMSFPAGKRDAQEVKRDDPIWSSDPKNPGGWNAATSIFVFV